MVSRPFSLISEQQMEAALQPPRVYPPPTVGVKQKPSKAKAFEG